MMMMNIKIIAGDDDHGCDDDDNDRGDDDVIPGMRMRKLWGPLWELEQPAAHYCPHRNFFSYMIFCNDYHDYHHYHEMIITMIMIMMK